jgi:hypothetical protein
MKTLLFIFSVIFCYSCNNETDSPTTTGRSTDTAAVVATPTDTAVRHPVQKDSLLFAIRLGAGMTLSLQQWDSTIDLQRHLGKPLKQKTRKLDKNSDSFAGSFIKDTEYKGLKLQLFSPPQNGRSFWIQEITLTSDQYKTANNITIGDAWQKVKQAYPALQKFPGQNEDMYYVANEGYEKSIEMEFEKNKLKKLRMYYMLN